jgi:hypothetical protein
MGYEGGVMKVPVKKTKTRAANANSEESAIDLEEQIRRRAYDLYEWRGCGAGHDTEDWLQAEAELAAERNQPVAVAAVNAARKAPVASTGKAKATSAKKSGSASQIRPEAD